ncbi:cobaltochelatase subunit CobN [Halomonas ventosae]|uniref:Cobaltochelatase CobN subunit n=1 Tax=Halomonas ventosae TaxID=229007 RepID=A0A2T0VS44_9GAMM|nr:cobaltochelatase subunit CobN [Halomonas ventosae]PRY73444.1 cobaltochelatase CobN subunit [Halomonas ventosae]
MIGVKGRIRCGVLCLLALSLMALPTSALAKTLFGIVSERSAPALAAGADRFAREHPGHELVLRTPRQLEELSDRELVALWETADATLMAGVFGEGAVPRLARLLDREPPSGELLAVSSDRRLVTRSRLDGESVLMDLDTQQLDELHSKPADDEDPVDFHATLTDDFPEQAAWLRGRAYWQGRSDGNLSALMAWLLDEETREPEHRQAVRYYQQGEVTGTPEVDGERPLVAVLDLDSGDEAGNRILLDRLCRSLQERDLQCLGVLARWGAPSRQAVEGLARYDNLAAVVNLQDFVIGGGGEREAATAALETLDVPVLKGLRLPARTRSQWQISEDGMPWDSVHYQLAMPELQGVSQPLLLATAGEPQVHEATGLELQLLEPDDAQVARVAERARRWQRLQSTANKDKRLAIVYYNHPPGRHNVGADNLDVPESLWDILHRLRDAGYDTGPLPESPDALLDLIQTQGINLPENRRALADLHEKVPHLDPEAYEDYFDSLPASVRSEMEDGPLGYLQVQLRKAEEAGETALGKTLMKRTLGDIEHLLEGADHPIRERALRLLGQLKEHYDELLAGDSDDWQGARRQVAALVETGIEGLKGWGKAPGRIMTHDDDLLIPGLRFGKILVGPQPPRGWELNEELLHANTTIPPTHQYLGFYHWLRSDFRADAIVHLGRHSTYEFLPRRRAALGEDDYPLLVAGDIPGIYPYIVDGVGEGLQAKRRGLAVIIDHLTPPLKTTELYDELLELRQLVESWESAESGGDSALQGRAMEKIRETVEKLEVQDELVDTIAEEHGIDGLSYDNVDDAMLVHEIGHYLTDLQEDFMPHGLHVFGQDWDQGEVDLMLESMGDESARGALEHSPRAERDAFLAALNGRFVSPGQGNDPIRSTEALPTGRNFHALDGAVMPTKLAYELGEELAETAREGADPDGRAAVVLWASDTVRDEGTMVAFGMALLGVKPEWNSRGIVAGLERVDEARRDVLFTTSGLFRDLYPNLLAWLDRAVLLALDGASKAILQEHPELEKALQGALEPLGEMRDPGNDSLAENHVARHWVDETREAMEADVGDAEAGRQASLRLFGDAPGAYGAGVNRLVERSGAWEERSEVAGAYLQRMGHAYGVGENGRSAHDSFHRGLSRVSDTYLGRASHLYGLLDNNDAFDYLGGLNLAVETLSGEAPQGRVIEHADPERASIERLDTALVQELRGRYLNPEWLKPLMQHDYAGARTMGSEFLEYLWGWQVTNPEIIESWAWDAVKEVYLDDSHDLGLDAFLEEGHNVHVKTNMEAILLVAAQKGYWEPGDETRDALADQFARHVVESGLPGSGHTRPDHPMLDWIEPRLDDSLREKFQAARAEAQMPVPEDPVQPTRITELHTQSEPPPETASSAPPAVEPQEQKQEQEKAEPERDGGEGDPPSWQIWLLAGVPMVLFGGGLLHGALSGTGSRNSPRRRYVD